MTLTNQNVDTHIIFTHLYNVLIISCYSITLYYDFQLYMDRRGRDSWIYNYVCNHCLSGRRFSPGSPIFSINKSNRHDIAEILLKVTLNTITLILTIALQLYTLLEKLLPNNLQSCFNSFFFYVQLLRQLKYSIFYNVCMVIFSVYNFLIVQKHSIGEWGEGGGR